MFILRPKPTDIPEKFLWSSILNSSPRLKLYPSRKLNPLVGLFDYMRYAYLGVGEFAISDLVYPSIFSIVILAIGVLVFNKTQKTFMDTV